MALIRTRASDPEFLLLRRAINPADPWSGHFALPGGRRDETDRDLLDTCLRECWEEVGIRLEPGHLVKPLRLAVAGAPLGREMVVAPFLFEVPSRPEIRLADLEIAAYHWLSLSYLLDPKNRARAPMLGHRPEMLYPCIRVGAGADTTVGAAAQSSAVSVTEPATSATEPAAVLPAGAGAGAIWGFTYGVLQAFFEAD